MYYMNTDRDTFHDWAREKTDTSFDPIRQSESFEDSDPEAVGWGRLVIFALLGAALVAGFKWFAGL
ncbi:hypothetical protein RA8CHR_04542 [Variovorax sp. RA8]|nr:hypothetical protein RA8CHR_04542 [Variovorax sp. RA8]